MHYIYLIRERNTDKVVYVGETIRPWTRWIQHLTKQGNFNREEHYMDVSDELIFLNKKEVLEYEFELQKFYGFETQREKNARGGKIGITKINHTLSGLAATKIQYICPHCNKIGNGPVMFNWHFDRCRFIK